VKYLPYVGICFHHMMGGEVCAVWDDAVDRKAEWDFGSLVSGKLVWRVVNLVLEAAR
jgi:hypothetical protein